MKISTAQFFRSNSEALSKGQFEVSSLQAKLGSGKQITTPSDDPKRANLVSRLESALERQSVYQKNIEVAKTRITSEETALSSITVLFQRAIEISIVGANGTMAVEDRRVLGAEVEALRNELIQLANTRDVNGEFIFGGNRIDTEPFVRNNDGSVSYVGDYEKLSINVSDSRVMTVNTIGAELLSPEDFLAMKNLEEGLKTNDLQSIQSAVNDLKESSDNISVAFGKMAGRFSAMNSQEELLEDTSLRIRKLVSETKDLDYAKAITELSQGTLALQALQASFTKISQLSLFNFIR